MRIAIPNLNNEVYPHFGHTKQFQMIDLIDNQITSSKLVDTNGQGHAALVDFLVQHQVDTLICGSMGQHAKDACDQANIQIIGGAQGKIEDVLQSYVSGTLENNLIVKCGHHKKNLSA